MESLNVSKTTNEPRNSLLRHLADFMFNPHPSITDVAEQRKARLTLILTFVLTLTNAISVFFVARNGIDATLYIQIILTIVTFLAYLLGRGSRFLRGSITLIASLSLSGFANILTGSDNPTNALYSTIPVALIIGSALLPVWGNVVQFLGSMIGMMILPVVTSSFTFNDVGDASSVIITAGVLLIVVQVVRDNIERARVAEVQTINQELRELGVTLEQRVADRTRDLAIVAEVGTATATILETDKLLQEVVDLTKERFNLYHSHIYLLDESGQNLVLASGAGEPGRQMKAKGLSIPLNREQSLVARAARERKGVTVNDVTLAPDFLPNPLLPDTRSELAVPMIIGGKVIGVFDVQSDQVGRFTDSDINIQTTLAAQVATSIQNVRSFEQSKSQADLESLVNAIGQKIQRTATVEDTLQTAIREIGLALGASRVSANIQANRQHGGDVASHN